MTDGTLSLTHFFGIRCGVNPLNYHFVFVQTLLVVETALTI